jgi:protein-disulfide isomerase
MSDHKKFEFTPAMSILAVGVLISGTILFTHFYPAGTLAGAGNGQQNQQPTLQQQMNPSLYLQLAQALGVDTAKYQACVDAKTYQKKIDADAAEAQKAGGQGTPFTVAVDTKTGKQLAISGALPYDQLKAAIGSINTQGVSNLGIRPPSADDHIIGSPTAPIVLVEYSDFQCPYCKMIHPDLKRIVSESNGQIAWVYRDFPLYQIHPEAENAANAAECIAAQKGNDAFWQFGDAIFES